MPPPPQLPPIAFVGGVCVMAEVIGRSPEREPAIAGAIRRALERAPIVPGESRMSTALQRWESRLSTGRAPNWAEAMEEDMLSLSFTNRISDFGELIGIIDRAGRKGPDYLSRKLDEHPDLESFIQDSLDAFQEKQSLNRQAGLKAIEMNKFILPKKKAAMNKKFSSVLQSLLADPEGAEQFKQFLKDEQGALFHDYRRLISENKDPDFSGMSEADRAAVADSLRQEEFQVFQYASSLEEGDPVRRRLEARSRILDPVEATIAIEVVEGEFCGKVTAHTTGIKKRLLLYDSQVAGHKHAGDDRGPIKMMRPVICVSLKDELVITAKALGGKYAVYAITPKVSRGHRGEFTLGTAKMRLQVDWSIMDP